MTVENTISKTGKQVMGSRTYDFTFDDLLKDPTEEAAKAAIKCSISNGEIETQLVYGRDYSVTLNNNRKGGRVTVADPKDAGWRIVVYRSYEPTQGADYNDFDAFPAETNEQCFDKLTMLIQEIKEELRRCVKVTITGNQTPEQLLAVVYDKLDSAEEIARQAIAAAGEATTAAENATAAVQSAEQTLIETQTYVDTAKTEINTTKETAISAINTTKETAESVINSTKTAAETSINATKTAAETAIEGTKSSAISTINTTVSDANTTIQGYVADAEAEVRQIAREEAESAIADAAAEATATAKINVNTYVNNTIKPDLQTYVTAASGHADRAQSIADAFDANASNKTTAFNQNAAVKQSQVDAAASAAATSAANAATSETNAASSASSANSSKTAVEAALAVALELTGYAEIFGGTCGDNTDDELVGGYIQ